MHDFEEKKKVTKQMQKEQDVDKLTFDDKLEIDTNDEVDFDDNKVFSMNPNILTDSDANDHKVFQDYEECCEEEIPIEKTLTNPITSWILSSGRDAGVILSKYCEKIPHTSNLSGEDMEVKKLFTDDEWSEILTIIAFNFQRLQLPMSEAAFGSNFTNTFTKRILTFDQTYHYEEGEIQGLASSVISNLKTKPTDRSLIGQKVDFRIRVLTNEGIESNDYNYNIYGLDWRSKGVWHLGLLQKVKLPTSIDYLPAIEKLIISLLHVEVGNLVGLNCIFMVLLIFDHFFDRKLYIVIEEVIESVGNACCIAHAINLIAYDIVKENFGDCLLQQTRWTATESVESVIRLEPVLEEITSQHNHLSNDKVKHIIQGRNFFSNLQILAFILDSLRKAVLALESRSVTLSDCFLNLVQLAAVLKNYQNHSIKCSVIIALKNTPLKKGAYAKVVKCVITIGKRLGFDLHESKNLM
nr:7803_t:CDS:10 [Entrophospora candida]